LSFNLEITSLAVSLVHLLLPELNLSLLLSKDPLGLGLELFLLLLAHLLLSNSLTFPVNLDLLLLRHKLLLLLCLLLSPLPLLYRLQLRLLPQPLLLPPFAFILFGLSPSDLFHASLLLFSLFQGLFLVDLADPFHL
jgi:hypothetical protein